MTKALLIASLVLATFKIQAQTPSGKAKLEAKHGIRDIKLGTPKAAFSGLYKVDNRIRPCGTIYQKKNENLIFGTEKAERIEYLFVNEKLQAIYIYFNEMDLGVHKLEEGLTELYGPPFTNSKSRREWKANTFKIISDRISQNDNTLKVVYQMNNLDSICSNKETNRQNKLKNDL